MSDETIERIFNNTAFRNSLSTTRCFTFSPPIYRIAWAVWVFVDYHTIHVLSKSRYTKEICGDYSLSQLSDAIEDINKFIKEIKLHRVKERIRDIDKDFINLDNSLPFYLHI